MTSRTFTKDDGLFFKLISSIPTKTNVWIKNLGLKLKQSPERGINGLHWNSKGNSGTIHYLYSNIDLKWKRRNKEIVEVTVTPTVHFEEDVLAGIVFIEQEIYESLQLYQDYLVEKGVYGNPVPRKFLEQYYRDREQQVKVAQQQADLI